MSGLKLHGPIFDILKALHKMSYNLIMSVLDSNTVAFWLISRIWEGSATSAEGKGKVTVEQALKQINNLLGSIGPHHPLRSRVFALQQDIIYNAASAIPEEAISS